MGRPTSEGLRTLASRTSMTVSTFFSVSPMIRVALAIWPGNQLITASELKTARAGPDMAVNIPSDSYCNIIRIANKINFALRCVYFLARNTSGTPDKLFRLCLGLGMHYFGTIAFNNGGDSSNRFIIFGRGGVSCAPKRPH